MCSNPVVSDSRGRPKTYCSRSCARAYARTRRRGYELVRHVLTQVDETLRVATCSACGEGAKIWSGGNQKMRWRCAAQLAAQAERRKAADPSLQRLRKLRSRGVVVGAQQLRALEDEANGHCQLCGKASRLFVDHCHATGNVRGLLCTTCNTGLGVFKDDPIRIMAAAEYLESYER